MKEIKQLIEFVQKKNYIEANKLLKTILEQKVKEYIENIKLDKFSEENPVLKLQVD